MLNPWWKRVWAKTNNYTFGGITKSELKTGIICMYIYWNKVNIKKRINKPPYKFKCFGFNWDKFSKIQNQKF